ncbi:MAG: hypothetical protein OZSIB_2336 [Candidatus Ozemobacter sibiricus]|uniref:Uncharacterized protein n=1 Tax=Candidatus Ozemobacter sibiricus TaxID=2268124 RepID=A0A367ZTC4_9BACT|nr:MAG: hypothetical protein OZSIB_2336 [Candidatus Ozemobacter sibiricus]
MGQQAGGAGHAFLLRRLGVREERGSFWLYGRRGDFVSSSDLAH